MQHNLTWNSLFVEGDLKAFVDSDQEFIVWPVTGDQEVLANFERFDEAMNVNGNRLQIDFLRLKHDTLNLIFDFFNLCKEQQVIANNVPVDYQDKFNIHRVEHYLAQHLLGKFPGIEFLASRFGVSESKLKAEFKQLFGKPVYQYFQEQQMQLAKELLIDNHLLIKEVSYRLGYENTSKFSAAFKKYHHVLPSDLQR
ncbi:helix-turn-helix transcriptional regulator [Parapedobacter sp. 10938]|uniref:helix-turn-helix transcriptional regulator n=1 Tax=Parapedobacter flavus TaxID=3110225 RepID=UPI002DBFC715|nr:AraC family transcriptional regulator [Parapedobacter sp. 10938]MEC3881598.1 AraC family transcriptional regulator [Parapedobacter sp. 10938]